MTGERAGARLGARTAAVLWLAVAVALGLAAGGCEWRSGKDKDDDPGITVVPPGSQSEAVEDARCREPGALSQACGELRGLANELIELGVKSRPRPSRLEVLSDGRLQWDADVVKAGTGESSANSMRRTWETFGFELQGDSSGRVLHFAGRTGRAQGYEARVTLTEVTDPDGGVSTRWQAVMWRAAPAQHR